MIMLKLRDWTGRLFAIALIIILVLAAMVAMGKHVPIVSDILGR